MHRNECVTRRRRGRGERHKISPYLLRGVEITRPNQVWACNITYEPMPCGDLDLTAVIDWFSRHVLSWRISNSMDVEFCLEALEEALSPDGMTTNSGLWNH